MVTLILTPEAFIVWLTVRQIHTFCAIPEIYDTARTIRIFGEEDEPKEIGINGQMVKDQEESFDLRKGKYDTKVLTGAAFTTPRQEAAAFFNSIVEKRPELMETMGDLLFKNSDFAGAQAMAERWGS